MKKILISLITIVSSFLFLIMISNVSIKAANCDVPSVLRITCNVGTTATDDVNISVQAQLSHEIYDSDSEISNNEGFNYKLLGMGYMGSSFKKSSGFKKADKNGVHYGNDYYYAPVRDKWTTMVGQILVRGEDTIIFPDVDTKKVAYNKSYAYRTCKKWGFLWLSCKKWSDYRTVDIHTEKVVNGTYKDGKLTYTDLSGVRMVMPSFEINLDESPSKSFKSSTTGQNISLYRMEGYSGWFTDKIFEDDNFALRYGRGCFVDYCTMVNYIHASQVLMTHLVMVYETNVVYYYSDSASPTVEGGLIKLNKGEAKSKVIVTYEMKSKAKNETLQSVNGYSTEDSDGASSSISYVPTSFDVSYVLDPQYWTDMKHTGEVTVSSKKFAQNSTYKLVNSQYVFTKLTSTTKEGIYIRALGVDDERVDTISLDVSGRIYYSAPNIESTGLSVTLKDGGTDFDESDLLPHTPRKVKLTTAKPTSLEWYSNNKITITVQQTDSDFGDWAVYTSKGVVDNLTTSETISCVANNGFGQSCTSASGVEVPKLDITSLKYTEKFNSKGKLLINKLLPKNYYVGASGKYSNKTEMLAIKIIIDDDGDGRMEAAETTYYFAVIHDSVKPKIEEVGPLNDGYIVVSSNEKVFEEATCNVLDDVKSGGCEVIPTYSEDDTIKQVTLVAKDWVGNEAKPKTYSVIVDGLSPKDIEGNIEYDIYTGDDAVSLETPINSIYAYLELQNKDFNYEFEPDNIEGIKEKLDHVFDKLETEVGGATPVEILVEDEANGATVNIHTEDDGKKNITMSGIKGSFIKTWTAGKESSAEWTFYAGQDYSFKDLNGTTYFAVIPMDNIGHLYKQNIKDLESMEDDGSNAGASNEDKIVDFASTINIKVYKLRVFATPYVNKLVASENGLTLVVRDDLDVYNYPSLNIKTEIKSMVIVDKVAGASNLLSYTQGNPSKIKEYVYEVLTSPSIYDLTKGVTLSYTYPTSGITNTLDTSKVTYNPIYNGDDYYLEYAINNDKTYVNYADIKVAEHLKNKLKDLDNDVELGDLSKFETFGNMMLINGMLLNNHATMYMHVAVNENGNVRNLYQRVDLPSKMSDMMDNAAIDFYNPNIGTNGESIDDKDELITISGDDSNSFTKDGKMYLKYGFDYYATQQDRLENNGKANVKTYSKIIDETETYYEICHYTSGEMNPSDCDDKLNVEKIYKVYKTCVEKEDGTVICKYNDNQYNTYYKICYETLGTTGETVYCDGEKTYFNREDGVNLGNVTGNVLYHVYAAISTGIEYDYQHGLLIEKYNNDEENDNYYKKFEIDENLLFSNTVLDGEFEVDYCRFLYDTSIPEITVSYETVNEYVEGQINKLKDPGYVEDMDNLTNYIVKVTLKNESDKYRSDPADWMRLKKEDIKWFPYYESTSRSVCGDVDRMDCDAYFDYNLFDIMEIIDNSDGYTPIVYYIQFPLSSVIKEVNPTYSVDIVDLAISTTSPNGKVNNGMTLVVDDVVRKQNVDWITIHYDQDAPNVTITSSPQKNTEYYGISISATDRSSNVAKVSLYYGKFTGDEEKDSDVVLLYSDIVNSKDWEGYSARLTQRGWYSVVAEDDIGLKGVYNFEVVQVGDGVMYSPTLDDTDQLQNADEEAGVVITMITVIAGIFFVLLAIGIVVLVVWLKIKFGGKKKLVEAAMKKKGKGKGKGNVSNRSVDQSGNMKVVRYKSDETIDQEETYEDEEE